MGIQKPCRLQAASALRQKRRARGYAERIRTTIRLNSKHDRQMNKLNSLTEMGFVRVGSWCLEQGGLDFKIDSGVRNKRWALYAFVDGDEVLYIGKSTIPFHKRMYGYKRPGASQKTNIKNNAFIAEKIRAERG